jgi:histidyl-tRNA synthetase
MDESQTVEPRVLRGFRDHLPAEMNARLYIIATIRKVYELYGFQPLDTPAQEYRTTLLGYGDENTKQIFTFQNPEDETVGLRFDLTAPLARVVAQYPDLVLPFRRYQVATVWRADKPDPGRYREFTQFDIDSVGPSSMAADVEIIMAIYDALQALGLKRFKIRFSDRKILAGLLDFAGIARDRAHKVFRVLDKLDKIGVDGVAEELTVGRVDASGDKIPGLGISVASVDKIRRFLAIPQGTRREVLAALTALFSDVSSAAEAMQELGSICAALDNLGIPEETIVLDQSIARGLEYYTGPVFEAILTDAPEFGSVVGGGRYDGLVERFVARKIPAVGASIGIDRLLAAMQKLGLIELAASTAQVLVTVMEPSKLPQYQKITRELRLAGINTEMYLGDEAGLGKQLQYANRQDIPVAIIIGSDEFSRGEVTVKNLKLGAHLQDKKRTVAGKEREEWLKLSRTVQTTVPAPDCIERVRKILSEL